MREEQAQATAETLAKLTTKLPTLNRIYESPLPGVKGTAEIIIIATKFGFTIPPSVDNDLQEGDLATPGTKQALHKTDLQQSIHHKHYPNTQQPNQVLGMQVHNVKSLHHLLIV